LAALTFEEFCFAVAFVDDLLFALALLFTETAFGFGVADALDFARGAMMTLE
jgi:hypothetical protein